MKIISLILAFLILTALSLPLCAQMYNQENWSQGTGGGAVTACSGSPCNSSPSQKSWYGTLGASVNTIFITNAGNTLTYQTTSLCDSGTNPPGSSGKILDWAITTTSAAYIAFNLPAGNGGTGSNVAEGVLWFCINLPSTGSQNLDECDCFVVIGSGSQLMNLICNAGAVPSGHCGVALEGSSPYTLIDLPIGHWNQITWQYAITSVGTCNSSNLQNCVRLRVYDSSGNQITACYTCNSAPNGDAFEASGGTTLPQVIEYGQINAGFTTPPADNGYHVQYMDPKMCYTVGCSTALFPMLENPVTPWDGIVSPGRAIDWSKSGFPGGGSTLPDASWTQCGSTLAAGTYAGSTITSTLAGCSANTYYKLGVGTFNITGQIVFPTSGNVVLRGSGPNSTFLVASGSGSSCTQETCVINIQSSDGTDILNGGTNVCNWTAGYAQGSTQITLSNLSGNCPTAISTSTPTVLAMTQANTGYSGVFGSTTGCSIDNSQEFIATDQYSTSGCNNPNGASVDGGGNSNRDQVEFHTVTAAVGGGVYNVTPPIELNNWASGQTPQVVIYQPIVNVGVENMAIDTSAAGVAQGSISLSNGYNVWVSGVRSTKGKFANINFFQVDQCVIKDSYVWANTGTEPSQYGIRLPYTGNCIFQNNIVHGIGNPFFVDGSDSGNVFGYNFCPNADDTTLGANMQPCFTWHEVNNMDLAESNAANQFQCDDIHGTCDNITQFRNFFPGWTSCANGQCGGSTAKTGGTNARSDFAFARYGNSVANVMGTPGVQGTYQSNSSQTAIYLTGAADGPVPADTLVNSTMLRWASYDTKSAANRFCGNSLDTGWSAVCGSATEAPASASTWPNNVPVVGDTAIGENSLPYSYYLGSSAPSWWGVAGQSAIPYPAIGPDVSGGNVIQCGGTINTAGDQNGVAAVALGTGCTSGGTGWAGHVNAIPAMLNALTVMGMPPDGTGGPYAFDNSVYGTSTPVTPPTPTPSIMLSGLLQSSGKVTAQ